VIKAVVLDIGGVLEIIDDAAFPDPWCARHRVPREALAAALDFPADPLVGGMTEAEIADHLRRELGLDDAQLAEFVEDQWRWYVGTLDRPLCEWFAALRSRGLATGILSNSGPGAREREACWGFEDLVDVLVYSHEVGMKKPDPRIYAHTADLLGVEPSQIAFLDDWSPAVEAARAAGWHAVHHLDTASSIDAMEELLDDPSRERSISSKDAVTQGRQTESSRELGATATWPS
jgi:putative hydrolase of the HAD superfamily